jgi:hypothetical protein
MVTATAKTTMPTTMMAAMATATMDDDNVVLNDVNIDVVEDDDNYGTTKMRWRQGQMDDSDAMAMGGQRHAERSGAPRHPSEATINLCRQFGEESTRERDNFGGG